MTMEWSGMEMEKLDPEDSEVAFAAETDPHLCRKSIGRNYQPEWGDRA